MQVGRINHDHGLKAAEDRLLGLEMTLYFLLDQLLAAACAKELHVARPFTELK